jgi:hypothetical protein
MPAKSASTKRLGRLGKTLKIKITPKNKETETFMREHAMTEKVRNKLLSAAKFEEHKEEPYSWLFTLYFVNISHFDVIKMGMVGEFKKNGLVDVESNVVIENG